MIRKKEHRLVFNIVQESDLVIVVLDARIPTRTQSPRIEAYIAKQRKTWIICLNKTDLVPLKVVKGWKRYFEKFASTVYISTRERLGTKILRDTILETYASKRMPTEEPCRACVVGVPNTGKSSLTNVLKGRRAAPTSSMPGYTRSLRLVKITPKLYFMDTPGVAPIAAVSEEEQVVIGALPVEKASDPLSVFDFLLSMIRSHHSQGFRDRFLIEDLKASSEEILTQIAKKRGRLMKGGEFDLEGTAKIVINEFVTGKFPYYEKPP